MTAHVQRDRVVLLRLLLLVPVKRLKKKILEV
jgi:hypothetical protein